MFNARADASRAALKGYIAATPRDPLGHSLSAAVAFYCFAGNRLRQKSRTSIHETVLFAGIGVPADIHEVRSAIQRARALAHIDLEADPLDQNALVALCIAEGVDRDVLALAYRRWMTSLEHAQAASLHARRLLQVNPRAHDAYYVIGLSEYVLSRMPSFLRAFTKIPGVVGQMPRAIQFLEATANGGCYLRDFARQMLVTIYLEDRKPREAVRILEDLTRDFTGNAGYRAELERLKA
jgi:hypothetical protein